MEESLLAIAFNGGLTLVVVQLLKQFALPFLQKNVPFLIPIIASLLGIVMSFILTATGIDISPIAGLFAGMASTVAFPVAAKLPVVKRVIN